MTEMLTRATGVPIDRVDGHAKVTGAATYAYEYPIKDIAYVCPVQSTIAAGRITSIDVSSAAALPGVLAVLTHDNAPRLRVIKPAPPRFIDVEVEALQTDEVTYRGQFVAAVVAGSLEAAQEAARLVAVEYEQHQHSVTLRADDDRLFRPARLFNGDPPDTATGDTDRALASASVSIDATYTTPACHHNPMEPQATIAIWSGDGLTLYDSNQGPHVIRAALAAAFGLPIERIRVISPYVGGGFGAKGLPHPHLTLTAMAAQVVGRPVKLALTRQQMSAVGGYRTPTIQRVRLGADPSGTLTALSHDVVEQTSLRHKFVQHTAVTSRLMYAAPNRATTHRVARLNMPLSDHHAGPGGGTRDVRAGVGHGRARGRLRGGSGAAADPQSPTSRPGYWFAVQQPRPGPVPARGRPPVRLATPRGATGRSLADRLGRRRLNLPGHDLAGYRTHPRGPRWRVPGTDRCIRHWHRRPYGAHPDRR
jgi:xanthine dehydrogenase YagR molybdenum-binding subunit